MHTIASWALARLMAAFQMYRPDLVESLLFVPFDDLPFFVKSHLDHTVDTNNVLEYEVRRIIERLKELSS